MTRRRKVGDALPGAHEISNADARKATLALIGVGIRIDPSSEMAATVVEELLGVDWRSEYDLERENLGD